MARDDSNQAINAPGVVPVDKLPCQMYWFINYWNVEPNVISIAFKVKSVTARKYVDNTRNALFLSAIKKRYNELGDEQFRSAFGIDGAKRPIVELQRQAAATSRAFITARRNQLGQEDS
jgi:hypothetical protein